MNQEDICNIWIEYLKESNFKKNKGESAYRAYIERIKAISRSRRLTPWPTVQNLSDIIGSLIERVHSITISDGDSSIEHFKKRLLREIKLQEQTNLLLFIHCPGIPPRGGQEIVLKKVRKLLGDKLEFGMVKELREFYSLRTEPSQRIVPELSIYLELYRARKRGVTIKELQKIARKSAEEVESKRLIKGENSHLGDDYYYDQSQVRRAIQWANKILRNVENGVFPGEY